MKKNLFIITALGLLMMSGAVSAEIIASGTNDCGKNCSWSLDDAGNLTITGSGAMKEFSPSTPAPWAGQMSSINNVKIDNNMTSVGTRAFYNATNLQTINIPTSATKIGSFVFVNASSLQSVDIPDSVTSIGQEAFKGASSLTSLNITDESKLKSVSYSAFSGTSSLTSINLPDTVSSIGAYAFSGSGIESIEIPANVTSIGQQAFDKTTSLKTVTFIGDSKLETIGIRAFQNSAIESFDLPDSVTSIDSQAFINVKTLKEFNISENSNLTALNGNGIFTNTGLTEIYLPEGLESICENCFNGTNIETLVIPSSVKTIGSSFVQKSEIKNIIFAENSQLETLASGAFYNVNALETLVLPPNLQFDEGATLNLKLTNNLKNLYLTSEQAADLEITGKTNFTPTIYQLNPDGTVSVMADVEGFLGVENQSLPKVAYASFADLVTGTISEQYTYDGNKKRVYDAKGVYQHYCKYQADLSSACFSPRGKFLGRYDTQGNRIYKKIYTVEEAMEATKDGERFNVLLRYK